MNCVQISASESPFLLIISHSNRVYYKSGKLQYLSSTDMQKITSAINLNQKQVLARMEEPRQDDQPQILEWEKAIDKYLYPVNLSNYKDAKNFPNYFLLDIAGDKDSTRKF
jgi:hypothetical protein